MVLISVCGRLLWVNNVGLVAKNGYLDQLHVYAECFVVSYGRWWFYQMHWRHFSYVTMLLYLVVNAYTYMLRPARVYRTELYLWMSNAYRWIWIQLHSVRWWPDKQLPWLWWWYLFLVTRLRRIRAQQEPAPYGPRTLGQQHRLETLQTIYNSIVSGYVAYDQIVFFFFFLFFLIFLELEVLFQKLVVMLSSRFEFFLFLLFCICFFSSKKNIKT
jgi:hypothetical protein